MEKYNPNIHHRKSIRLKGYDYSQAGLYFITICCENREHRFGKIENGEMIWNDAGKIAHNEWLKTPEIRPHVELGEFIIMPNHIHGIIRLTRRDESQSPASQSPDHIPDITPHCDASQSPDHIPDITPHCGASHTPDHTPDIIPHCGASHTPDHTPDIRRKGELHSPQLPDNQPGASHSPQLPDNKTGQSHPTGECDSPLRSPSQTIGAIVRGYKSSVTKQLGLMGFNGKLWQRNYYEHIIRNEQSYENISNYIINNPANWKGDKFNS